MNAKRSVFSIPQSAIDLALFASSLLLYALTLTPSVLSADNGEFQLVAWKLGIAHPPGYPLYTIVGFLFSRFFTSPAFALNLFSAILAAFTLVLVSRAVRIATGSIIGGLAAAIILGTSTTFWAQATTANIRMPTALFTAGCVYALMGCHKSVHASASGDTCTCAGALAPSRRRRGQRKCRCASYKIDVEGDVGGDVGGDSSRRRYLTQFALAFSLGLGHHPSILFPGIFFVVYLLLVDPALVKQPRRWLRPVLVFLLGLTVLVYLPIRGATGGALADGEPTTSLAQPDKFLDYILARGFEGDFFYFLNTRPDLLGDRLALLPTLFNFQFNLGVMVLAGIGSWKCLLQRWRLLVLLLGGILLHTFVALTYRAPQTVEYLLPAYVLLAILIGCGIRSVITNPRRDAPGAGDEPPLLHSDPSPSGGAGGRRRKTESAFVLRLPSFVSYGLVLLALGVGLAQGISNLPSFVWLSQNEDTRAYAESLLNDAPPNAVILSNWHWANPMWYLQQVEGLRPDVAVMYVFPRGEPLPVSWLNSISESLATGRPVVVDMFFRDEFSASPYIFEPISREAFLVRQSPITDSQFPIPDLTPLEARFADRFTLLGYRLLDTHTSPGEPLTLFLAWRVETQPDRDYSFFVHLVDSTGRVIGQSDRTLPTTRHRSGDAIVERFFVAPLVDTAPGEYALVTGIYSSENGAIVQVGDRVQVASATIQPSNHPTNYPTIQPTSPAIPLAHGIYFLDPLPYPQASTLPPGSRLTLDLHFRATRPLTRDFVVSVQMVGQGQAWKVTSDSVPALGAIPTLKWIAGSEIVDRHVIDIPADAPPGPATISLILYDSFTQQPLALLDEQLIQHGASISLGTWHIAP
ncbi:MAG TPA: DUF2723 domain-containing protein [Anaerolineae bacterium]|nr:DUF2723 domain-containing protein [Anaerolineae bacterium]